MKLKVLILIISVFGIFLGYFKYQFEIKESLIKDTEIKVKAKGLTLVELVQILGKPVFDEISNDPSNNFNSYRKDISGSPSTPECSSPIRAVTFEGNTVRFFGHFEDRLQFYFDSQGKYCDYRRLSL